MNTNPESNRPDLEAIINEVSASEDFQNLLKSVSKNIGDIVESSRSRNEPDEEQDASLPKHSEKPAASPAISPAASLAISPAASLATPPAIPPAVSPAASPAASLAVSPAASPAASLAKTENLKDDLEIRTVPLDTSASVDDDDDNLHDTILTLLSDGEGNTLGDIASSIDHHLGKISSSLETLVQHHTKKASPPSVELPKIPTLEVD
jgi:hypothetical protein